MGVLNNSDHERFCQLAHKRIWAGEKRSEVCHAVYLDVIYDGEEPESDATKANVRKFYNRDDIKARMAELAEYAAKLAGIDAGWAQLKLKAIVEANMDDYLAQADENGDRIPAPLGKLSRDHLAHLGEISQEERSEYGESGVIKRMIRRMSVRVPTTNDKIAAIGLMAKIAGWLAPEKQEHSGGLTLEQLVTNSMKPKQGAGI